MAGIYLFQKKDPGDWEAQSDPDYNAKITDVSSRFVKRNTVKRYYETEVKFSDGYIYISKKTNTAK